MNRFPVKCRLLAAIGYDYSSKTLELEFHEGEIKEYHNVPERVFNDLMAAKSKSSFYLSNIDSKYNVLAVS